MCQNSSRSTVNMCNRWMSVMPQWSSFLKICMHSPLRVSLFVSSLTKASQHTLRHVALPSLFCTFRPSFPQSSRTHCAVWACLLPSFCSFFYYFLEKGEQNLDLHGLDSTLICIQSHTQLGAQLLAWEMQIKTIYSPDTDGGLVQWLRFQLSEVERWESSTDGDNTQQCPGSSPPHIWSALFPKSSPRHLLWNRLTSPLNSHSTTETLSEATQGRPGASQVHAMNKAHRSQFPSVTASSWCVLLAHQKSTVPQCNNHTELQWLDPDHWRSSTNKWQWAIVTVSSELPIPSFTTVGCTKWLDVGPTHTPVAPCSQTELWALAKTWEETTDPVSLWPSGSTWPFWGTEFCKRKL